MGVGNHLAGTFASAKANLILSQARANSVVKALTKRRVDPKRLTAKGYGQEVPIADNGSCEAISTARSVETRAAARWTVAHAAVAGE